MSATQFVLDTLERTLLGLPARMIGRLKWRHSHFLGMINLFHVPSIVIAVSLLSLPRCGGIEVGVGD